MSVRRNSFGGLSVVNRGEIVGDAVDEASVTFGFFCGPKVLGDVHDEKTALGGLPAAFEANAAR